MDIGFAIGIIVLIIYIIFREIMIWTTLSKADFEYEIRLLHRRFENLENKIKIIDSNKTYCYNCLYYKKCNGKIR